MGSDLHVISLEPLDHEADEMREQRLKILRFAHPSP